MTNSTEYGDEIKRAIASFGPMTSCQHKEPGLVLIDHIKELRELLDDADDFDVFGEGGWKARLGLI